MAPPLVALLVLVFLVALVLFFVLGGSAMLGERAESADSEDSRRPEHVVREPTDEHAVGYGVQQEYDEPRPARVRRDEPGA
ncbi:MAG: hypothetical protein JWN65_3115 [Solirubrobacterales bacterium]|nr:hypothetical protein [Solirubrobacterales bacterium]